MDYTQLVAARSVAGSIASWANHDAVATSAAYILEEAQSQIYRRLRHWRMLTRSTSGAFAVGQDYIALSVYPNFLEEKKFVITGVNYAKLTPKTEEQVVGSFNYDGAGVRVNQKPCIFYKDGTNFYFDSPSDQIYPTLLNYYKQPDNLSGTNLTNFLTLYYQRMLRCACMAGACEFMKDAGMGNFDRTYWITEMEKEIALAQVESDMAFHAQETQARID